MDATQTAWETGRLDGRKGPKAVLFGQTYEDAEIERAAFEPGGRVMCIASAGCTPRLLSAQYNVVAVDINPVQVDYARARLGGEAPQPGRAERVMAVLRGLLPLAGISRAALQEFIELEDPHVQAERWRTLCTARFRLGLNTMFGLSGLRFAYSSPLLSVLPPRFGQVLLGRLQRAFATHPNRHNPFARALFLGELRKDAGPAPAPVELVCADAAAYLESQPAGSFDGISLSNILAGAGDAYRRRLFDAARQACRPSAKVVIRSFREPEDASAQAHATRDRSMLWGSVQVLRANALAAPTTQDTRPATD